MIDFKKKMEETEKFETSEDNFSEAPIVSEDTNKKQGKITFYIVSFLVVALVFSGKVIMSSQSASDWLSEKGFFNNILHLVPNSDKNLAGEEDDRINILLLGMGGEGHDGAYLTDTIILASFKPSTEQVAMLSIPRDLYIPISGSGWRKINYVNALAESKGEDGGKATSETLGELFQVPIHYYVRADFQGFINIINKIGGINVDVENTLDDYAYPILGEEDNPNYYSRFEHLHIEKGPQKMSGELALKYARSRHGYGIEGSDFARAKRQQLVLEAVKNKLFSKQTLLNPVTITNLAGELNRHISTDLEVWEIIKLWNMFKDTDRAKITNKVLSDAPGGLLASATSDYGAYILNPVSGNFGEIRNLIKNIIPEDVPEVKKEDEKLNSSKDKKNNASYQDVEVVIKNATWINGLAAKAASVLKEEKINISETSNAPERDKTESLLYDLSYGDNNDVLEIILAKTPAKQSFAFPDWLKDYTKNNPDVDFVLLLGTDANK